MLALCVVQLRKLLYCEMRGFVLMCIDILIYNLVLLLVLALLLDLVLALIGDLVLDLALDADLILLFLFMGDRDRQIQTKT